MIITMIMIMVMINAIATRNNKRKLIMRNIKICPCVIATNKGIKKCKRRYHTIMIMIMIIIIITMVIVTMINLE